MDQYFNKVLKDYSDPCFKIFVNKSIELKDHKRVLVYLTYQKYGCHIFKLSEPKNKLYYVKLRNSKYDNLENEDSLTYMEKTLRNEVRKIISKQKNEHGQLVIEDKNSEFYWLYNLIWKHQMEND